MMRMHTSSSVPQLHSSMSKTKSIQIMTSITLLVCICACTVHANSFSSPSPLPCLTEECLRRPTASDMLRSVDATIDPCADFYAFACNKWIRENPIPPNRAEWNILKLMEQRNQLVIRNALERPDAAFRSQAELKAKRYYESCLDERGTIELLGVEPMQQLLRQVGGWNVTQSGYNHTGWQLQRSLDRLTNRFNVAVFFERSVEQYYLNSSQHMVFVMRGGLALPSRENYLSGTANADVLHAYLEYMVRVAVLLGGQEDASREQLERVVALETRLAEIPGEGIEFMTVDQLQLLAPFINWLDHLNDAFSYANERSTINGDTTVTYQLDYYKQLNDILEEYNRTEEGQITLNNYMVWQLVNHYTPRLSQSVRDARLPLDRALYGTAVRPERWRLCVDDALRVMGFAVGAIFVRQVFDDEARRQSQQMVTEIRSAVMENIRHLDWMDAGIRNRAIEKANAISIQIGYPDYILDGALLDEQYGDLRPDASQYFENNVRVGQFRLRRDLRLLSQPAKRTTWAESPAKVNAYYSPLKNQIMLPAGILRPPVFDVHNARSRNFGSLGMTIGHELTHAFDAQGKQADKDGNVNRWWNNRTEERFAERTGCLVKQYNGYRGVNGRAVNGRLTLNENIADNGGIKAAYRAFERTLEVKMNADAGGSNRIDRQFFDSNVRWLKTLFGRILGWPIKVARQVLGRAPEAGSDFTDRQMFFLSAAQFWCSASTEEMANLLLDTGMHAPNRFRVIGPLSNLPEFSDVFGCALGSPMNPVEKCEIW